MTLSLTAYGTVRHAMTFLPLSHPPSLCPADILPHCLTAGGGESCADPGIPAGASRSGSSFGIDDKVTYRCDEGLHLVGSKQRVCKESGQWTGTEPKCYCKDPWRHPKQWHLCKQHNTQSPIFHWSNIPKDCHVQSNFIDCERDLTPCLSGSFVLVADKHTYDTALEITEAFGSAIRESLQLAAPIGRSLHNNRYVMLIKSLFCCQYHHNCVTYLPNLSHIFLAAPFLTHILFHLWL